MQDAVWEAFQPLIPEHPETHPYGGHRRRVADRLCFDVIVIRLASGVSWVDAALLAGGHVSDTTVRARRDEWIEAGIFDAIESERSPRSIGSSAWTCQKYLLMAAFTRPRAEVREPAKTRQTGANSGGSGRSRLTRTASLSVSRSTAS
ncbi:MAG: transposase [Actinobacteria bacterium]|nr:transposase [Actinomycetota bacterium]